MSKNAYKNRKTIYKKLPKNMKNVTKSIIVF